MLSDPYSRTILVVSCFVPVVVAFVVSCVAEFCAVGIPVGCFEVPSECIGNTWFVGDLLGSFSRPELTVATLLPATVRVPE